VDTPRPSPRTNRTRRVPLAGYEGGDGQEPDPAEEAAEQAAAAERARAEAEAARAALEAARAEAAAAEAAAAEAAAAEAVIVEAAAAEAEPPPPLVLIGHAASFTPY
jgi:hypothetical protein